MTYNDAIGKLPEYNQAYVDWYIEDLKKDKFYTGCVFETARAIAEYYNDDIDIRILQRAVNDGFLKTEETA